MGLKGIILIVIVFIGYLLFQLPYLDIWYDKIKNFLRDERKDKLDE